MVSAYPREAIIVRAREPSEFLEYISETDMKRVQYLQLLSLSSDTSSLARWGEKLPLDLVMTDPEKEFPLLYRFSHLLNKHPVRVSVPPVSGFSKAVKLAASLNFAVRITGGQTDAAREMEEVLHVYLRHPTVSQPIEYFHSVLLSFFHEKAVFLPTIQEEDPGCFRYITEQGEEAISERLAAQGLLGEMAVATFLRELPGKSAECPDCDFLAPCGGYFKWPERDYSCAGVKRIFRTLKKAAKELREDYAASLERTGENNA
jgi:hypothetical protein